MSEPIFFIALAHTDGFAKRIDGKRKMISLLRVLPERFRENVLFSLAFDNQLHHDTAIGVDKHEWVPEALGHSRPKRIFADCSAFGYRNQRGEPVFPGESVTVTSKEVWRRYKEAHMSEGRYRSDELLLCAPDHMICRIKEDVDNPDSPMIDLPKKEYRFRKKWNEKQAKDFFNIVKDEDSVTPVGVIHGHCDLEKDLSVRKKNVKNLIEIGYKYVALGGVAGRANDKGKILDIVAGIKDLKQPRIAKGSILDMCRKAGVKLHIFGLNSPDWYQWWIRLGVDSFDGSKLSTEGAANGWYWYLLPEESDSKPETAQGGLYDKIAVDEFGAYKKTEEGGQKDIAELWEWKSAVSESGVELSRPVHSTIDMGEIEVCECPACKFAEDWQCASDRCNRANKKPHSSDPRCMGSTEHNMMRVAHNAHVLDKVIERMLDLNRQADEVEDLPEEHWLNHWTSLRGD